MPQPFAGPTTRDKVKAQLGITDNVDDAEIDDVVSAVNVVVRPLPVAQPATRTVTLTTANASGAVTAAPGTFQPDDLNATITGPTTGLNPVPAGAVLSAVASDVAATMAPVATATASVTVTLEAGAWSPRVVLGATMLGARLFRRRNSASGVETFSGQGVVYVQRNDPDIAQMLELGDYARPAVG